MHYRLPGPWRSTPFAKRLMVKRKLAMLNRQLMGFHYLLSYLKSYRKYIIQLAFWLLVGSGIHATTRSDGIRNGVGCRTGPAPVG